MVWAVFSARCRACKHQTGVSGTGHEMSARTQEIGGRGHLEARSSPWWSSPEEVGDTQPSAVAYKHKCDVWDVKRPLHDFHPTGFLGSIFSNNSTKYKGLCLMPGTSTHAPPT